MWLFLVFLVLVPIEWVALNLVNGKKWNYPWGRDGI